MTRAMRLISSMATKALLADLAALYTRQTGTPVEVESVGGIDAARRVQDGEAFDAVMLASQAIDTLLVAGRLLPGSRVDIVDSGVAVA
ncbi:MAG TPA: substrate-binding domain-containing protein, partial [Rubrivivax sp.]|nr:substrate-binding domain-containing protein [Rubrivivax sp.]